MGVPRTMCGGVPSVDRRRCEIGSPNCELPKRTTVKKRQAKQAQSTHRCSNAIHRTQKFCDKNRRERELEPQLTLGAPRSQTRQRGCDHANQDRPWPLSKCKALPALLSLDGHSLGGKRKVNLNRATTQAKREHKNQLENLCAILEMVNSKS